jgi:isochorismate pyruvate lyase
VVLICKNGQGNNPCDLVPVMQNDAIKAPENCGSMAELRVAIDALDEKLVTLLARRQTYIERAAVLKSGREQVHDSARIEDVVRKVVAAAKRAGLSPAIAEPVWRRLVEASIAHEFEAFDKKV